MPIDLTKNIKEKSKEKDLLKIQNNNFYKAETQRNNNFQKSEKIVETEKSNKFKKIEKSNLEELNKKLKMKNLPETERPYEKLKMYGAEKLSNAELLAIIIKTGTKKETALDLANKVLKISNTIEEIRDLSISDLKKIEGIGDVKAIEIMAVCELAKRMKLSNNSMKMQIKNSEDIYNIFSDELKFKKNEIIRVVILNIKNYIVKIKDVAIGDSNCAHITIKMIVSENIRLQEPKLILVHNHPSGNSTPSEKDIEFTQKLYSACNLLGIELLDHIVIGNGNYKSIFAISNFKK